MNVLDLDYILRSARAPKPPLTWVSVREQPFDSGNIASGGGNITIDLPRPAQGYVRRWESLHCNPSGPGMVPADQIFLTRISSDFTTGTVLFYFTGLTTGAIPIPAIGGHATIRFATEAVALHIVGIDPLMVDTTDVMRVFLQFNAPLAQNLSVRGWYKDLPV